MKCYISVWSAIFEWLWAKLAVVIYHLQKSQHSPCSAPDQVSHKHLRGNTPLIGAFLPPAESKSTQETYSLARGTWQDFLRIAYLDQLCAFCNFFKFLPYFLCCANKIAGLLHWTGLCFIFSFRILIMPSFCHFVYICVWTERAFFSVSPILALFFKLFFFFVYRQWVGTN